MADYGLTDDRTLMTLTGTRDALRASCRSLNEYYEPEVEETIHKSLLFSIPSKNTQLPNPEADLHLHATTPPSAWKWRSSCST
ncbi:hypothetical protein TNCV_1284861 [Trichonephila clavipes]|uniref:Uncharacterized protein n=1 Tax=Trichonephila clavipes TaxID=2585209 RepID=A0A8X6SPC7_TRICX|nr:hypothetical protein TNCV_1284861 [Trichonephila clavipes]